MRDLMYACVVGLMLPGLAWAGTPAQTAMPQVAPAASTQKAAVKAPTDAEIIQRVEALMQAGRLAEARAMLTPLRQRPQPAMQVLFLSGLIDEGMGDLADAAGEFRLMLIRDPKLPRPRLELARALFLMKDYEGARYNFEQVMATDIPPAVRHNIDHFLYVIREQVPTFNLAIEMVNDSNPIQRTSAKTVTIGGLNFRLNSTAPARAVTGMLVNAGARIPLPGDPSWYVRLNSQWWDFPNKDMDQDYFQATAGKSVRLGRHTLSLEIGAQQFQYQWQPLYHGAVYRLLDYFQQHPTLGWKIDLERRDTSYFHYPYLDGWQAIASLDGIYTPSVENRLESGLIYVYSRARAPSFTFANPNIFARVTHEWPGGLITGASVQYGVSIFKGMDPFFGVTRMDHDGRVELDVLDRQIQMDQFSPRLSIGYIRHDSNIRLYAYKRAYVNLGVSRDF